MNRITRSLLSLALALTFSGCMTQKLWRVEGDSTVTNYPEQGSPATEPMYQISSSAKRWIQLAEPAVAAPEIDGPSITNVALDLGLVAPETHTIWLTAAPNGDLVARFDRPFSADDPPNASDRRPSVSGELPLGHEVAATNAMVVFQRAETSVADDGVPTWLKVIGTPFTLAIDLVAIPLAYAFVGRAVF